MHHWLRLHEDVIFYYNCMNPSVRCPQSKYIMSSLTCLSILEPCAVFQQNRKMLKILTAVSFVQFFRNCLLLTRQRSKFPKRQTSQGFWTCCRNRERVPYFNCPFSSFITTHTTVYEPDPGKKYYSQTGKTVNTRNISGMLLSCKRKANQA